MITDRDIEIIQYVQDYGFITIGQCYNIWLKDRRYGYDLARKRLNKIQEMGYLKSYKDVNNIYSEKVWFIENKYQNPSRHLILTMDVYAELIRLGADILYYKREKDWVNKQYRSDGFVIFRLDNYIYSAFVEVIEGTSTQTFSQAKKYYEKKYGDIFESNEPLETLKEIIGIDIDFNYPHLIIIDNVKHKTAIDIPNQKSVIFVDFKMNGLSKVFA